MNIVQAYAPTTSYTDTRMKELYSQFNETIRILPKQELAVVMRDFNSKIEKGLERDYIGP